MKEKLIFISEQVQIKPFKRRGVEQLAARQAHNLEVRGSNPLPATNMDFNLKIFNFKFKIFLRPGSSVGRASAF